MKFRTGLMLFPFAVAIVSLVVDADAGFVGTRRALLAASNFINPPQFTSFSTPGLATYTIPTWAQSLDIWIVTPGGGGGSGREGATSSIRTGGNGGATGAGLRQSVNVAGLGGPGASLPIYVGAGGAGGAAVGSGSSSTNGNPGSAGHGCGIGAVADYIKTSDGTTFDGLTTNGTTIVADDVSGSVAVATSPLGPWTTHTTATAQALNAIVWASSLNLFVVVANGGIIETSPDGVTWTAQTSGTTNNLLDVTWDGTTLVAVGALGTIVTSTNATAWSVNAFSSTATFFAVAADGAGHWVTVDNQGNAVTATSPAGTWTSQLITPSTSFGLNGVQFANNVWVATANAGLVYTSANSTSWTSQGNLLSNSATLSTANNIFFSGAFWSTDGLTWHPIVTFNPNVVSGPKASIFISGIYYTTGGFTSAGPNGILMQLSALSTFGLGVGIGGNGGAAGTAATSAAATAGIAMFPGGLGGANSSTASATAATSGVAGGGGAGGSADASNNNRSSGSGAAANTVNFVAGSPVPGGTHGIANGSTPSAPGSATGSQTNWGGGGGAGGAFNTSTTGQSGTNGGNPGGGGGGGGAADNTFASGAGGNGGNCEIKITAHASYLLKRDLAPSSNDNAPMYLAVVG